jgi:hypothetical protein
MSGARIVHDTLEACGWSVQIADAHKVKGLAPLACKTDKIDSMVLAVLSHRDLVPAPGTRWLRRAGQRCASPGRCGGTVRAAALPMRVSQKPSTASLDPF